MAVTRKRAKVLSGGGQVWGLRVRAVPPRPFLRPAWEAVRPAAAGIILGFLTRALAEFWEKSRR